MCLCCIFAHLMIGGLLIFWENFFFIIKRLFFHKHMLFTATSAPKWFIPGNRRKTAARPSTASDMMTATHRRPVARPAMLINSLKNGLKIFVFWWSRYILCCNKRITNIVSTHRGLQTLMCATRDCSWWNNWVFSFSGRWFWSRGFTHFTVGRALSVILRGMLALP